MSQFALLNSDSFYNNHLYFEKNNTQTFILKNITCNTIIFKVQTSIYKNCLVKPCTGLIKPACEQKISINIFNEHEIKSNIKFLIKFIQIYNNITSDIWITAPDENIYTLKFNAIIHKINNKKSNDDKSNDDKSNDNKINDKSNNEKSNDDKSNNEKTVNDNTINDIINNDKSNDEKTVNDNTINESENDKSNDENTNDKSNDEKSNDENTNDKANDENTNDKSNDDKSNDEQYNIKYDKSFLKKLNKMAKHKIIKEKSEIAIQCNIKPKIYFSYLIYFLIFFCGLIFGAKLILM